MCDNVKTTSIINFEHYVRIIKQLFKLLRYMWSTNNAKIRDESRDSSFGTTQHPLKNSKIPIGNF